MLNLICIYHIIHFQFTEENYLPSSTQVSTYYLLVRNYRAPHFDVFSSPLDLHPQQNSTIFVQLQWLLCLYSTQTSLLLGASLGSHNLSRTADSGKWNSQVKMANSGWQREAYSYGFWWLLNKIVHMCLLSVSYLWSFVQLAGLKSM